MSILDLFDKCLTIEYETKENSADIAFEKINKELFIYFQWSNGKEDWQNNFDFLPCGKEEKMGLFSRIWESAKTFFSNLSLTKKEKKGYYSWRVHGGFKRVWLALKESIQEKIHEPGIDKITVVGFSHGAAIAVLAHLFCVMERPDIEKNIKTYAFAAPRVYWGRRKNKIMEKWDGLTRVYNKNDIVTKVPPAIFGFKHVGREIKLMGDYNCIDSHRPENIAERLRMLENIADFIKR